MMLPGVSLQGSYFVSFLLMIEKPFFADQKEKKFHMYYLSSETLEVFWDSKHLGPHSVQLVLLGNTICSVFFVICHLLTLGNSELYGQI